MKPAMREVLWGLGFVAVFAALAFVVFANGARSLERALYDVGVQLRSETPSDRVAIIAIDDESIANLGRWPWPRNLHASMIDRLSEAGVRAIGNTVLYFEAQRDPGLDALDDLSDWLARSPLLRAPANPTAVELNRRLQDARESLAVDQALANAMQRSAKVGLAMTFTPGMPVGRPDAPLPDAAMRLALPDVVDRVEANARGRLPLATRDVLLPIPELLTQARFLGHLNTLPDIDGAVRFDALVLRYYDALFPSLPLALAAGALNLGPADIQVRLGEGIALGNLEIPTTTDLRLYTHYYRRSGDSAAFSVDSFFDVLSGRVPASKFRDRVVLIGATATGIGDRINTPVAAAMPPVEAMAHTVSSLLEGHYYVRPSWAWMAEIGAFVGAALYLALVLPFIGPLLAAILTIGAAVAMLLTTVVLLSGEGLWLQLVVPSLLLLGGHLFVTVRRLRLTERLRASSEVEGAESNRMLGLAFQGQGQLDMAFEKFKRVKPVDDRLLDLLYNLALDYERKRQFNKAESVYQFIASCNPSFRDVADKLARARRLSETVIFGTAAGPSTMGGTLVLSDAEKPMLGRYEVEKELGKGAMGVVYLGRDPKIGRQVAIKTMSLAQEFDSDELPEVKARFFREAETAGRLSHPNIVSIFDAGEEHDLAYIAMEYIQGYDLTRHIKPDTLLPVADVLKIVADAAEALDYAHAHNVVHRDIKPANLMWLTDRRIIKVTDFGIARITDASRTKTGIVLGSPSYMSPEQIAGRKVDGRSDLFSLAVTLYQLLTGTLPFQADSMATLMFKIGNEPHVPMRALRPDLPEGIDIVLARALRKDPAQRLASGKDFAAALRRFLAAEGN
jgi:CHASE2 domain-containing sensor protein/predicted Ser/Thr protein kinase